MGENRRKEEQESRRSNDDSERKTVTSEVPQITVVETLHEQQTFNHGGDHTDPVVIFGDSANMSTIGEGMPNCGSFAWTETSPGTSSISSDISYEYVRLEESPKPSENQMVICPETSIPPSTSEPHLQHPGPSTSVLNPSISSLNEPSSAASNVNALDLGVLTPASTAPDRPQSLDQILTAQLWESRFAGGALPPSLMHIPPPPYAEYPPRYEATERACSVTTISDLQRAALLSLEMPPSYDAAREDDRVRVVQDLRRPRSSTATDWNTKNFLCCVSFAFIVFIGLAALGFIIR